MGNIINLDFNIRHLNIGAFFNMKNHELAKYHMISNNKFDPSIQ